MKQNRANRMHNADLHVDCDARPGWIGGDQRALTVGEEVYCAMGAGEVAAILGKVGDGSRLLEIRLPAPGSRPYFAAASNVRVVSAPGAEVEAVHDPAVLPAHPELWLG
jgi:hypothetical protein